MAIGDDNQEERGGAGWGKGFAGLQADLRNIQMVYYTVFRESRGSVLP